VPIFSSYVSVMASVVQCSGRPAVGQHLHFFNVKIKGVTGVYSAFEVIFNVMRSINPRFTYSLTYLLTYLLTVTGINGSPLLIFTIWTSGQCGSSSCLYRLRLSIQPRPGIPSTRYSKRGSLHECLYPCTECNTTR